MNTYDKGDLVTISASFKANGAAADPTNVTLRIKKPDDSDHLVYVWPADVVRDGLGEFHKDIVLTTDDPDGVWTYRFEGTGAVVQAGEGRFRVRESAF